MNTIVYFDGKKTKYFVNKIEHKEFNKNLDFLLKNPEFVAGLTAEGKEFLEDQYFKIRKMSKDAKNLNNIELAELYNTISEEHAQYYTRMWMIFRICERITKQIKKQLITSGITTEKSDELIRIFSTPLVPNDVIQERIEILNIVLKANIFNKNVFLKKHVEKYRHIPMFDFDHKPYTYAHFFSEFKQITFARKELRNIRNSYITRKKEFNEALKTHNPDEELYNLIMLLKRAVILRDYRDKIRQKLNMVLRDFYTEIASRIGLIVEDIALLTNEEIFTYLSQSKEYDYQEIIPRKNSFLLLQQNDKIHLLSGDYAYKKAQEMGLCDTFENKSILRGMIGSPGKIQGRAKIIHTNLDLHKIKKDDIMIATMTRQDYVSHLRQCQGVITDEGGVTCHAAIIAREFKIPCIVGTNNATQIFNDGDLIELNGDNGTITKLS